MAPGRLLGAVCFALLPPLLLGLAGCGRVSVSRPGQERRLVYIDVEHYLPLHPGYKLLGGASSARKPRPVRLRSRLPEPSELSFPVEPSPFVQHAGGAPDAPQPADPAAISAGREAVTLDYLARRTLSERLPPETQAVEDSRTLEARRTVARADISRTPSMTSPVEEQAGEDREIEAARLFELERTRLQQRIRSIEAKLDGRQLVSEREARALRRELVQRNAELVEHAGRVIRPRDHEPAPVAARAPELRSVAIERLRRAARPAQRAEPEQRRRPVLQASPDLRRLRAAARTAAVSQRNEQLRQAEQRMHDQLAAERGPEVQPSPAPEPPPADRAVEPRSGIVLQAAPDPESRGGAASPLPRRVSRGDLMADLRLIALSEARKLGWLVTFEPGQAPDATQELRPHVIRSLDVPAVRGAGG